MYKNEDEDKYSPIICYKGNTQINGYKATDLVDLCDGFLEARTFGIVSWSASSWTHVITSLLFTHILQLMFTQKSML